MKRIAAWLRRLAAWLDPPPTPPRLPDLSALDARTRALVAAAEQTQGSGEYKRHQVYAQLLKACPDQPRRALAMAIERAVSALP